MFFPFFTVFSNFLAFLFFSVKMETLRRKMEVLSRGMLDRMEEYGYSVLSTGTNSSPATASNRIEIPEMGKRQQARYENNNYLFIFIFKKK